MNHYSIGQSVFARGREWIVVCPKVGDVDLLIADPLVTDEEKKKIERTNKVCEAKNLAIPHGVYAQRTVLDICEIT